MSELTARPGDWPPVASIQPEAETAMPRYSTEHTPETRAALYSGVMILTLTMVLSGTAIVVVAWLGLDLFGIR